MFSSTAKDTSSPRKRLRAGAVGLVSLAALGLGACNSAESVGKGTPSASDSPEAMPSQETPKSESTQPPATTSSAQLRDSLAQLAADTSVLKEASQELIAKESVSDGTRELAQLASPVFREEEDRLVKILGVGVDPSLAEVDQEALARLTDEEGPHADMAYLTVMEDALDRVISKWESVRSNGEQPVEDLAGQAVEQLTSIREALRKRMAF